MTKHVTIGNPQVLTHPCPYCGGTAIRINDFERCQQCGRQFNQKAVPTAPTKTVAKIEAEQGSRRMENVQEPGVQIEREVLADKAARRQNDPTRGYDSDELRKAVAEVLARK